MKSICRFSSVGSCLSLVLGFCLVFAWGGRAQEAGERLPNIIYIMADDLGYGELGCYGQTQIRTPHIDRMAKEGMRFTQAYAGAHVCRPSRSTLMTGMHTGHTPIRANGMKRYLYDYDVTVAEVLRDAGYYCGGFGKWGLGDEDTPGAPWNQGFDEWFGQLSQVHAHFYYPYWLWDNEEKFILQGNLKGKREDYMADVVHERAKKFIRRNKDDVFFAYLAYTIPHVELVVPEDSEKPYRGKFPKVEIQDSRKARGYLGSEDGYTTLAGMISRLDRQVGEILSLVKELGIDENTLVIFTSDNGAQGGGAKTVNNKPGWQDMTDFFEGNGLLRGYKGTFYEGGLRVPFIARWPGKVPPGSVSDQQTAFWDFLPTCADIAGTRSRDLPRKVDGISILPTLLGKKRQKRHPYLYWEYPYGNKGIGQAARMGNWKGIVPRPGAKLELYNLKNDIGETRDVADRKPDVAERMRAIFKEASSPERNYQPEERRREARDFVQF